MLFLMQPYSKIMQLSPAHSCAFCCRDVIDEARPMSPGCYNRNRNTDILYRQQTSACSPIANCDNRVRQRFCPAEQLDKNCLFLWFVSFGQATKRSVLMSTFEKTTTMRIKEMNRLNRETKLNHKTVIKRETKALHKLTVTRVTPPPY